MLRNFAVYTDCMCVYVGTRIHVYMYIIYTYRMLRNFASYTDYTYKLCSMRNCTCVYVFSPYSQTTLTNYTDCKCVYVYTRIYVYTHILYIYTYSACM